MLVLQWLQIYIPSEKNPKPLKYAWIILGLLNYSKNLQYVSYCENHLEFF